jgi:SAM-dependent methyltransferase
MKFGDIFPPFRFRMLRRHLETSSPRILDVGCASESPKITKQAFPSSYYTAIDISPPDEDMLPYIDRFIHIDAGSLNYSELTNASFDVLILSHVLEHIRNGEDVLASLLPKLKVGGIVYIEFPSIRSLGLPSAINTLQFCDDPTHLRLYSLVQIANILLDNGFKVVDGGTRRDWPRIVFSPLCIPSQIVSLFKYQKLNAKGLWDIAGFAEFAIGIRKEPDASSKVF